MTFSSGTSTTLTKSYWPIVAHCALTTAPSCSTSLLTSLMRFGLFLTVWTPSDDSCASMMYVGMAGVLLDPPDARRAAPPGRRLPRARRAFTGARCDAHRLLHPVTKAHHAQLHRIRHPQGHIRRR